MTLAWTALAVLALAWPANTLGLLDGIPLNGITEALVLGLVVPTLLWLHPRFVATRWARVAVCLVIAAKAVSLALTPQGLCGRFFTPGPLHGEISTITIDEPAGVLRSWDVRADRTAEAPRCTAIVDRSYTSWAMFPAWFVNLVDYITPGHRDVVLELSGYVRATEAGSFSMTAGDDMAIDGTIGDRRVALNQGGAFEVPLEPGTHALVLRAALTGDRWRLDPRWNGRDAWSALVFTTSAPRPVDALAATVSAVISLATLGLVLAWAASWVTSFSPGVAMIGWATGAAVLLGVFATMPSLERFAGLALLPAVLVPVATRHRNLRGAFLLLGIPWLTFFAVHALPQIGRVTAYSGDDWLAYQVAAYRIFMHGYWLEGGNLAFDYQPLYRWINGALHLVFGDSSVGEVFLDSAFLLSGALLAFHLTRMVAGFRAGVFAAAATLATFTTGTIWFFVGRGLSEIAAAGFGFCAAFFLLRSRLGRWPMSVAAGVLGVLMFYTRLNHLIFAVVLVALVLPLRTPAVAAALRDAIARVRLRSGAAYLGVFAAGVMLFMTRTWWYTGVFSLLYGTSLKNNDTGLRIATVASPDVWSRILHSLGTLVWMNEPPHADPRAAVVVIGMLGALLAALQVPLVRSLPASLVLVTLGATASAFFVHTHHYPGRMSIALVPFASAATAVTGWLLVRAVVNRRTDISR